MQNVISQHIENLSLIFPATEGKIKFCPSLSARNKEQRKLFLILFYRDTGNSFTSIQVKQNKDNRRGYWFLAKEPQPGMGEQSEANPEPKRKTTADEV